jgi:plastocyanin
VQNNRAIKNTKQHGILFRMKKKYFLVIALLIIIISFVFLKHNQQINQQPKISTTQKRQLPKEVTITLDKNGFSPKKVKIKLGEAVRWKNESGKEQTVNSDTYPTNQLHKELNLGIFDNDSSVVYTFPKLGSYGYHNQFHPEQRGTVSLVAPFTLTVAAEIAFPDASFTLPERVNVSA